MQSNILGTCARSTCSATTGFAACHCDCHPDASMSLRANQVHDSDLKLGFPAVHILYSHDIYIAQPARYQ